MKEHEVKINKVAQSIISFEDGVKWFDSLESIELQYEVFKFTCLALLQSKPTKEKIHSAINNIPLKPTFTSVVLLNRFPLKEAIPKLERLPEGELRKSFISVLSLFKYCDTVRRNEECNGKCNHEWHNL
ncbi:DUF5958 family protein [Flammeovirga aprica]|uniref:Uncharacterized protein n=1 Tax=Flammeovirga aprica JL-4 TaxID=694437 RepID=A0A7X9S1V4_9BACT|nr:DUF5958 family protein [Flammeovirga aprica]NME72744.1 hypothetical protein [Flammeovirga aprica JL-4]